MVSSLMSTVAKASLPPPSGVAIVSHAGGLIKTHSSVLAAKKTCGTQVYYLLVL